MARIDVVPHLTVNEVEARYRGCRDAAEKTRWHLLWLLTRPDQPRSVADAGRLVGLTARWARTLVHRYNADGPDALADGRRGNGAPPKLTPERQAELLAALQSSPPDGGLWSGPKVAAFVRQRWGVAVVPSTGWQWLKDLGFRLVVPARSTPRRPPPASNGGGFDHLGQRTADLRAAHPEKAVEVWCEDEARVGLKPVTRRAWALRGTRPTTCGRHKFASVQVFGFAHPASGRNRLWLHPKANAAAMGDALRAFADWADPGGAKVLVVLVDNAGYHTAKKLAVPANVVLHFLPRCTPELQPAERLWPLLREAVANRVFDDLPAVSATVAARATWMADHPEVVGGVIGYHWAVAA